MNDGPLALLKSLFRSRGQDIDKTATAPIVEKPEPRTYANLREACSLLGMGVMERPSLDGAPSYVITNIFEPAMSLRVSASPAFRSREELDAFCKEQMPAIRRINDAWHAKGEYPYDEFDNWRRSWNAEAHPMPRLTTTFSLQRL